MKGLNEDVEVPLKTKVWNHFPGSSLSIPVSFPHLPNRCNNPHVVVFSKSLSPFSLYLFTSDTCPLVPVHQEPLLLSGPAGAVVRLWYVSGGGGGAGGGGGGS